MEENESKVVKVINQHGIRFVDTFVAFERTFVFHINMVSFVSGVPLKQVYT